MGLGFGIFSVCLKRAAAAAMFPSGIFIIISEDGDDQGCDFDAPTAIRKDDGGKGKASLCGCCTADMLLLPSKL